MPPARKLLTPFCSTWDPHGDSNIPLSMFGLYGHVNPTAVGNHMLTLASTMLKTQGGTGYNGTCA